MTCRRLSSLRRTRQCATDIPMGQGSWALDAVHALLVSTLMPGDADGISQQLPVYTNIRALFCPPPCVSIALASEVCVLVKRVQDAVYTKLAISLVLTFLPSQLS